MTIAPPLPRLDEAAREAEWLELSDDPQTLQADDLPEIDSMLADALQAEASKFVTSDQDRSMRQFTIGALLDEGEIEARNKEKFWEEASALLRAVSKGWSTFSENTLRRWVRTIRRIDKLIDLDKYRAYLPFEYFAAAGEMVNDKDRRYDCKDIADPLAWAVGRVIDGNPASVSAMKDHFLKDEYKPDPWHTVRDRVRGLRGELDKLPDNARREISKPYQDLLAAVERLERGEK